MPTKTLMGAPPLVRQYPQIGPPLVVDTRPGTILLRHNGVMPYDERILVTNWHSAMEGYPKDYDINLPEKINKRAASYRRWGMNDVTCPISESRHRMADVQMLGDFIEQQPRPPMITADNFVRLVSFDRPMNLDAGHPLPRHGSDHNKGRYNTTYCVDFSAPYSYRPKSAGPAVGAAAGPPPGDEIDWSAAVRRMKSQFTDVADHRRNGRNTWQDESGIYANEAAKRKRFVVENPIVAPKESPIIECPPPPKESNDVEFTYEPITGHHTVFNPEGAGPTPKTKTYKNFVTFQDEGCIDPWPKT